MRRFKKKSVTEEGQTACLTSKLSTLVIHCCVTNHLNTQQLKRMKTCYLTASGVRNLMQFGWVPLGSASPQAAIKVLGPASVTPRLDYNGIHLPAHSSSCGLSLSSRVAFQQDCLRIQQVVLPIESELGESKREPPNEKTHLLVP